MNATDQDRPVDKFLFRLALVLSVTYLIVVSLTIFLAPIATSAARTHIELMETSQLWLVPFKGSLRPS